MKRRTEEIREEQEDIADSQLLGQLWFEIFVKTAEMDEVRNTFCDVIESSTGQNMHEVVDLNLAAAEILIMVSNRHSHAGHCVVIAIFIVMNKDCMS